MKRIASSISLLWMNAKEDTLVSDRILVLGMGLLALAMAVVFVLAVMPHSAAW